MEISDNLSNSLTHYFNALEHTGYRPYGEVYNLLAYVIIEEMLTGPMSEFIDEKDYKMINNALYCLYGTCLIPYPHYLNGIAEVRSRRLERLRITEENVTRISESSALRVESK